MRQPPPFEPGDLARRQTGPALHTYAWLVHGLYAASFVTGFTGVAGVVLAYVKRGEAAGTIYESHLTYAIRTFWIGLAMTAVSLVLCLLVIGVVLLAGVGVWFIVRVVRPMIALADGRPVANPTGFV